VALASLTWPEASVYIAAIASGGLVVAVLIWSIFRTGQTAIRSEGERQVKSVDRSSTASRPSSASA
jgi:hypothetical protein